MAINSVLIWRARLLLLVLLLVFLAAPAGIVSASEMNATQASRVVHGWLKAGQEPLPTHLGSAIAKVDTFADDTGESLYHVVYLNPCGFVIVAADDDVEPIIGFVSAGAFDPSLDNPLGALVSRDLRARVWTARGKVGTAPSQTHQSDCQSKWRRLDALAAGPVPLTGLSGITDIRVAPFVQSRWNQQTEYGLACYNYYTPPYGPASTSNYPSGCVATAMAQLMRYYQYPTTGIGMHSFTVQVDGANQVKTTRGGDGAGGPYNWSLMMLDPDSTITSTQCVAIGALCYDAGVAVKMMYAAGGSGAYMSDSRTAMINTFGYTNAIDGYNYNATIPLTNLYNMVNPNLDAGYPVLFGIVGKDSSNTQYGHAVVCDGYGYSSSTPYHHLNMGWGSYQDAWYNLPTIDPYIPNDPTLVFNTITDCLYNTYPSGTGEIVSGRITDPSGNPLVGLTVTAQRTSGGTYTATTTVSGIYALPKVPANSTYTISVSGGTYFFPSRTASTGSSSNSTTTCGNCWGADIQGQLPTPPTATNGSAGTVAGRAVSITLQATDDGAPNPPGALAYIITSLPAHGSLADPAGSTILSVPYTLLSGGQVVVYTPNASYLGPDAFAFKANDGGLAPSGGDSNLATVTVDVRKLLYSANMDTNPGWTLGTSWAWGRPTGSGSFNHDPTAGFTGTNVIGYNLSGNYEKNLTSTRYAQMGPVACTGCKGTTLSFYRWLGVAGSPGNNASIQTSSNGTTWSTIWTNPTSAIQDTAWQYVQYDVSATADNQQTVYVRWGMGPTNSSSAYPGWNIDDVEMSGDDATPAAPTSPAPATGQTAVAVNPVLSWTVTPADPSIVYDVWLDTVNPPVQKVATGLTSATYSPGTLQRGKTWYWNVVSRNTYGQASGPVWSFRTILQGDINADGYVNVGDLQLLVASWGSGPAYSGPADLNGDGYVNVGDLQLLVANWGQF